MVDCGTHALAGYRGDSGDAPQFGIVIGPAETHEPGMAKRDG